MRKALLGFMFALLGVTGPAFAVTQPVDVVLCDGCSHAQMDAKAISPAGLHLVHIGNRQTGQLLAYWVDLTPVWMGPMTWYATPQPVTDERAMEFMAYSDAYRSGGSSVIEFNIYTAAAASASLPDYFPDSGFDITRDGAARQALLQWARNVDNWPSAVDQRAFYGKLIIQNGKYLFTGGDYAIRLTFSFPDGSTAKVDYESASQSLVVHEVRDSAGNLIYSSSSTPVQVDYSSYERPESQSRPDYNRGIGWLNLRGLIVVYPNGSIGVRKGTVIVGDVVTVPE